MALKIPTSSIASPSQIYPNLDFCFENLATLEAIEKLLLLLWTAHGINSQMVRPHIRPLTVGPYLSIFQNCRVTLPMSQTGTDCIITDKFIDEIQQAASHYILLT
jgi:hypothetical protein